jgi:tetratricopeptide (TPR) repeat protein
MLTVSPGSANVYTLLGGAYSRQGKLDEAADALRSAIEHDPEHAAANILYSELLGQQGHIDQAVAHLEKAKLRGTTSTLASAEMVMARLRALQGRPDDAVRHLVAAVKMQPHLRAPRLELGRVYLASGQLDEAREQYQTVLRLSPDRDEQSVALLNLGFIAARQNRSQEAASRFRDVLAIDPANGRAHFQLGLIAQMSHDAPAAINHYRVALAAGAESAARNNLAWLLATCPDAQFRDGKAAVELARGLSPQSPRERAAALDTLGAAYAEAGDFTAAVKTAEQAVALAAQEKQVELEREISARLGLYRQGKPYHEPAGSTR